MATPPPPPPTNMVVMVTGGSGLVGRGIKANIDREANAAETWIFLTSKDGDLRDKEQTRAIFDKYKPTHVIHLAARVGGLFSNMKHRVEFWRENVAINDNVLHLSHEYAEARHTRGSDMAPRSSSLLLPLPLRSPSALHAGHHRLCEPEQHSETHGDDKHCALAAGTASRKWFRVCRRASFPTRRPTRSTRR